MFNITENTISLEEGKRRTTNWRSFLKSAQASGSSFETKAVFISKEDIAGLAQILSAQENSMGVRAYFTLDYDPKDAAAVNSVRLIVVPVLQDAKYTCGKDIMNSKELTGMLGDGDPDSTIYDFTQPCPEYCDPTSQLDDGDGTDVM